MAHGLRHSRALQLCFPIRFLSFAVVVVAVDVVDYIFQQVASRRALRPGAGRCPAAVWLARNSHFALKQMSLFPPKCF